MKRRDFFKRSAALGGSIFYGSSLSPAGATENTKSKIVISRDPDLHQNSKTPDANRLLRLLDESVCGLANRDRPAEAWKRFVKPGEVIGLKVNCLSGRGTTHVDLVEAVCERLRQAGIPDHDIVIWDRFNSDLEDGGFKINYRGRGVRIFGNDALGFEPKLQVFGSAGSLVCKTLTRVCDGVINLPVLKDHGIAGITIALKNFFGAIHNPNKYHLNVGDPYIPDVYMFPPIRNKVRLTICDATTAQYEGGPSYMPQWSWQYNGLIAGTDPVALDYSGWQIIEKKRKEMGLKSLKAAGREPTYIATAADKKHNLGTNNPEKIEIVET